ncbi:hypothetical protein AXF42_Ash008874 [Apostasia shenzhenica]|uniref:Uncharacterized protein n=1 Tax=Apostasia shenzhenica TaxID=1088818 RepID=A0A2I0AST0_9ASPA|nr:hypothetical protein AXF42_Ash008874 [Apostasia shenzhenica]
MRSLSYGKQEQKLVTYFSKALMNAGLKPPWEPQSITKHTPQIGEGIENLLHISCS